MIPRPLGCDGNHCDHEGAVWVHVDCGLALVRGASEIKHPSLRATRRHFAANPMPGQQARKGGV
jgi:hypothetical protein